MRAAPFLYGRAWKRVGDRIDGRAATQWDYDIAKAP